MNVDVTPMNLKGNGTKFNVNRRYLIKELTFTKYWVTAKYSHREERNEKTYFVFNVDNEHLYLIECKLCTDARYEITLLK